MDAESRASAARPTVGAGDPEAARPLAPHSRWGRWLLRAFGFGFGVVLLLLVVFGPVVSHRDLGTREQTADSNVTPVPNIGFLNTTRQASPVFAQLLVKNQASLKTGILDWHSEEGIKNVHLSQGLQYEKEHRELVVENAGLYFVFLQLKLRQVSRGPQVQCQVSLRLQLDPPVADLDNFGPTLDLFPCSEGVNSTERHSSRMVQVRLVADHRLKVMLTALCHRAHEKSNWQLSQDNDTSFGLFLVGP